MARVVWLKRLFITLGILIAVLVIAAAGILWYLQIPTTGAGLAAKSLCSAAFVAGRPADNSALREQDVDPASSILFPMVSTEINEEEHYATGKFLGLFRRQASLVTDRGCVLDAPPDPGAVPYQPAAADPAPWPQGDSPVPEEQWPAGLDAEQLNAVVDEAFADSGDPLGANARGVAIVQNGRLLLQRSGRDIEQPTVALHGWSMTKTVAAMLAYKQFTEAGIDLQTPVVDAFPGGREPGWVEQWRQDDRARITLADLFAMRAGLQVDEGYDPGSDVLDMLYNQPDMAGWAADHPSEFPAGTSWEYLSAVSNILAEVVKAQFPAQEAYWTYPESALFEPIGASTATLETDAAGTWVASSYLWASVADWARLGQVMLDDGRWDGRQVIPAGWLELAGTPALPEGEGAGYGAQSWIPANPVGGECRTTPGVPEDTVSMEGHWGQLVAMVPSRDAVIVRLGWTFNGTDAFDSCRFISGVVQALPGQ